MNPLVEPLQPSDAGASVATERNVVLRNTYWLLALSMLPTVLGAWLGLSTGLMDGMGAGMSAIVFLVGAFGLMFAVEKAKNSAAGVPVLLTFTFFMGLMLSHLIGSVLGLANGAGLVITAFAGTGAIFLSMATLSSVIKRDLSSMGKFLFIGMIMLLVAGIVNIFLQSSALMVALSLVAVGGHRHLLGFHPRRLEARESGSGNQLHQRHARRLSECLQRVPIAAGTAGLGQLPGRLRQMPRSCG